MSSSDLFAIGTAGLAGFRAQMGAISENIANSSTPGFNRRSVILAESSLASVSDVFTVPRANFGGSQIMGVRRANDAYLDATARLTGSALGSANARLRWLTDMESALNDDSNGVGQSMAQMFGAVTQLAASPGDPSLRTNVLYGVERVVSAFNASADALKQTQDGITQTAQGDVVLINNSIKELARINAALLRSQDNTSNQAQLLDSRDVELANISQRLNIGISFGPNGSAVVSYGGATVVQGNTTTSFAISPNTDGTLRLMHQGAEVTPPTDGSLGGLFQSANIAAQRVASLDQLATQFAGDINSWHSQGLTDAGAAGGPLVTIGTSAASLVMNALTPADLAIRSSSGTLNGNLLTIGSVRGNGSVEQGWSALIVAHGNILATTKQEQAAAQSRDNSAKASRETVSGVDLDTEAADLLRVQQAYQGAAKIIQVAREAVDAILRIS